MSKSYNIEGNINFFDELYKSLDIDDNEDENVCLITNETLTNHFVQLQCNHKFNYLSLYNDIKNHKQKFNSLEGHNSQLQSNEVRCPYCRNKQTGLLPYYEELGLPLVHGVNYIDPNRKKPVNTYNNHYSTCQYVTLNPHYDPSGNDPVETNNYNQGNCKFFKCLCYGHYQISKYIVNYTGEDLNVCYSHKKKLVKDNILAIKNKQKEEAKKEKEEAKIKAKKEKEEAKLKAKEDKLNMKKKIKKPVENEILSSSIVIENQINNECIKFLSSGPNKGKQCGRKVYESCYCKIHSKKIVTEPTSEI
jgi:hypothetical protein